jgi:hypothetical protein
MGMGARSTMTRRPIRFKPATVADSPPQENDAKCGFACHTVVQNRDYVFTEHGKR